MSETDKPTRNSGEGSGRAQHEERVDGQDGLERLGELARRVLRVPKVPPVDEDRVRDR